MHEISANLENPYGSKALLKLFVLAHTVIHSFCAQGIARAKYFRCQLFTHEDISQWNQGLWVVSTALHTILSTKDVQKRVGAEKCRVKDRDTIARFAIFSTKRPACLVFAQRYIMHMNQRPVTQSKFLRTILSTKDVQNLGTLNGRMAQSLRTRICPQNPPLPGFFAA